ncbi:MAG: recombinase family protein [Deltaproteobacteria bacterium]|nr:recombinase family protein [Deltaproteobacteria bacterium]
MPEPTRRCVLYVRKSTDREDKQILSIPAQVKELREFAVRVGLKIDAELEEAHSAREPGRPVFSKLLGDVAAGRVERVLAWKLDRLARNPIDGGALIHFLGKGNLKEIVTLEGTYTGSGDSKFMLSVLFGAATKMTDDLVMGVRRGNKAVHEKGRITGSPPVGYMKVRDRHGYRGAGMVVPDPERFPLVKRAFHDVLSGTFTMSGAWRRAVAAGLTRRETANRPATPIGINHFYKLLENPFFCGRIVRCGEVFPGEHEPMLTPGEFERVQAIAHKPTAPRAKKPELAFLWRGLLRCGHCGRGLTAERIKGRFVYYRCSRKRQDRKVCRAPAPSEVQVTGAIEDVFGRVTLPRPIVDWTLRAVDLHIERERARLGRDRRRREAELAVTERTLNDLTDMRLAGDLTDVEYRARRPALLVRVEELRRDLDDPTACLEDWRTFIAGMLQWGEVALAAFRDGSDDEKRRLVVEGCVNLPVRDRILKPELRFPYQALLEAPKIPEGRTQRGVNRLPAPAAVVNLRKNARPRDARVRAFSQWWASIRDILTRAPTIPDTS